MQERQSLHQRSLPGSQQPEVRRYWGKDYHPSIGVLERFANPPDISKYIAALTVSDNDEPSKIRPGELKEVPWPEMYVRDFRLGLADGRKLAVQVHGESGGLPILVIPGTPSGRVSVVPSTEQLYDSNKADRYQVYIFDVPGYGRSDRDKGRTVASTANDVQAIADAFGIEKFRAIFGRSGGGPKALSCADLSEQVIALGAYAPYDATIPDRNKNLAVTNALTADLSKEEDIVTWATKRATHMQKDPFYLLRHISNDFALADWHFLINQDNFIRVGVSHALAVEKGPDGLIDDKIASTLPWGFDLRSIKPPKYGIHLWVGADDKFTPKEDTKWLGTQIPGAKVEITDEFSHFTGMDLMPFIDYYVGGR